MALKYKLKEFEVGDVKVTNGIKSTVTAIDSTTGGVSWDILQIPNIDRLLDESDDLVGTAKGVYTKVKDDKKFLDIYQQARSLRNEIRTHVRNNYPEEYKKSRGVNEEEVEETSTSGGAGAYLTPYAFKLPKKKKEKIDEDSQVRISEPRFVQDKNHPNFLNVYIDYSIGAGGVTTALGIETMTGQIRRKSAAAAVDKLNNIAKDLELKYNIEDIEVTDLENGKARLFAVSDDFINGVKEGVGATLGPGPKASEDGVRDNAYVKQFKYKLVPKNNGTYVQKGSGLEVKKLY
jgi:hypothetical protein